MTVPDFGYHGQQAWDHLPSDCLTIDLDGLTFTGTHHVDGPYYGITGWSGWLDGVDGRGGPAAYPTSSGAYRTRVDRAARRVTLEGVIEARDRVELWRMADALGRICTATDYSTMTVTESALDLPPRQVSVARLRKPQITFDSWTSALFTLELECDDWRKVAATARTATARPGQAVALPNSGDLPADLYATITGPVTGAKLAWSGGSWTYPGTIPAGSTRTVNFADRVVRDPVTSSSYRHTIVGQWPDVPATTGQTITFTGTSTSSATAVTMTWRDTWS